MRGQHAAHQYRPVWRNTSQRGPMDAGGGKVVAMKVTQRWGLGAVICTIVLAYGCDNARARVSMNEGNKFFKVQKYDQALQEYRKVVAIDRTHWDANYQIAMSYLAMYNPASQDLEIRDKAIASLEQLMKLDPPDEETQEKVHQYYLSLLTAASEREKAVTFLQAQLQKKPKDVEIIRQLATLEGRTGNHEEALRYYEQAAQLAPQDKTSWYTIGVVCWERADKTGVTMTPEDRDAVIRRGLDALDRALKLDPEYFEALTYVNLLYRQQALMLAEQGKHAEAAAATAEADRVRDRAVAIRKKQQQQEQTPAGTAAS